MATLFEILQQKQAPAPQYGGNALLADTADAARAMPQAQPLMRPTAERQRSRGPGLLDTIWGMAAGYSPNATRQMGEARELSMRAAENELASSGRALEDRRSVLEQITDPRERAVAMANMGKWGENAAQRYGMTNLSRGGVLASGTGEILAANPFTHETGDEIVGVGPSGADRIYTRQAPSIREQIDQDKVDADIALGQAGLGIKQAELGIAQAEAGAKVAQRDREAAERETAVEGANASDTSKVRAMNTAMEGIRRHLGSAGAWTNLQPWKKQSRADLEAQITALQGVITLDGLAEMKANSPNGASGMGAMSEREGQWLASRVAALDPNMRSEELELAMGEITDFIAEIESRAARRQRSLGGGRGQPVRVTSIAQARALPSGTVFIDPNGVRRTVP